jgi:uncharacterized RDD family membrane protein YckC
MRCKYCRSWNADDEHRCNRCGRRLKVVPGSQGYPASRSAAALAFAELPAATVELDEAPLPRAHEPVPQKLGFEEIAVSNVIPFESIAPYRAQPIPPVPAAAAATAKQAPRRAATPRKNDLQPGLDFLVPAPQGPRTLKTQVEAVIYCDADVAAPKHRAIAAALDGGMIFVGFGIFLLTFHLMGGMFHLNRQTIPFFIGVFGTLVLFYGILWIWAGRETLGMRWTGLRLVDFDGFPAERRDRFLRALAAGLSFCAGGLGLFWALVDEERLTWHDHMSKTFPTLQESNSPFFRKR